MKRLCSTIIMALALVLSTSSVHAKMSIEERLQVLEDKDAIRALLLDYGRHLDAREWDKFANLFAKNTGTWDGGMGVASGQDAIVKMMTETIGTQNVGANGEGMLNLHLFANEYVSVDGDTATALTKWAFVITDDDKGPDMAFIGHYDDTLVKEDGAWKFQRRTVSADITQPMVFIGLDTVE